jgi:hypothetical protein
MRKVIASVLFLFVTEYQVRRNLSMIEKSGYSNNANSMLK